MEPRLAHITFPHENFETAGFGDLMRASLDPALTTKNLPNAN